MVRELTGYGERKEAEWEDAEHICSTRLSFILASVTFGLLFEEITENLCYLYPHIRDFSIENVSDSGNIQQHAVVLAPFEWKRGFTVTKTVYDNSLQFILCYAEVKRSLLFWLVPFQLGF